MEDPEAWAMERAFWIGGAAHYRTALDPACVMVFPAPTGRLDGPQITESLNAAPRWSTIDMADRHVARPAPDLLVLAYAATGLREDSAPYRALCSSTYRRTPDGWRLVQHQQTPA